MKPIKTLIDPVCVGSCMYGTEPVTHKLKRTSKVLSITKREGTYRVETNNTRYDCKFTGLDLAETFELLNKERINVGY